MNMQETSKFVSSMRKEKGFTQQDLANKLAVSTQAVSKWETGLSFPDVDILEKLAEVFGITVDEILRAKRKDKAIVFEFGVGILPYASMSREDNLINMVSELHEKLDFPKVHFRDNTELDELQYRILVGEEVPVDNSLRHIDEDERIHEMLSFLKLVVG